MSDFDPGNSVNCVLLDINLPYLFEYKSHFFVPENQSKNGGATYTQG